jgi:hypothetical protein
MRRSIGFPAFVPSMFVVFGTRIIIIGVGRRLGGVTR